MSKPGGNGERPEREALTALEGAVGQALEEFSKLNAKVRASEAKTAELEEVVRRFTGDEAAGGLVLSRLKKLEQENEDLRERIDEGRAGVDRLLAKIRFLENQQ